MTSLTQQKCIPCEGGTKPLTRSQFQQYLDAVTGWEVIDGEHAIKKELHFKDFAQTLVIVNKIGALAESEGHHPDLNLHSWNKLTITLSTHAIGGLSINDFILAAKIDQLIPHDTSL